MSLNREEPSDFYSVAAKSFDFGPGIRIVFNPPLDGACQFSAVAYLLSTLGIIKSARDVREETVNYLVKNPYAGDEVTHLSSFICELDGNARRQGFDWNKYLEKMHQPFTFGDHLTLRCISQLYHVQIVVVSTIGSHATCLISPLDDEAKYDVNLQTILLGHSKENDKEDNAGKEKTSTSKKSGIGEHYLSLECDVEAMKRIVSTLTKVSVVSGVNFNTSNSICEDQFIPQRGADSDANEYGNKSSNEECKSSERSSECRGGRVKTETQGKVCSALQTFKTHPHQPHHCIFPSESKKIGESAEKARRFRPTWYADFPWLEWDEEKSAAFCHPCRMVTMSQVKLSFTGEATFSTEGYSSNWKKAKERLAKHGISKSHLEAVCKFRNLVQDTNVAAMVCVQKSDERQKATECLRIIFTSLAFLAKQGLAVRRTFEECGNFQQLLQLRAEDNSTMKTWLSRHRSFTSPQIQNEIIELISREVLLLILGKLPKNQMFSILADETSDISCAEQLSFCLCHVDDNFDCYEEFVGLYQLDRCQAVYIHTVIDAILVRCQLSWDDCRGVSFDGAANMAGIKNGVAARIQQQHPKALFAYCHMHCLNLCVKDTVSDDVPFMRDFFSNILELTSFIRHSPKRMAHLRHLNSEQDSNIQSLRPLCPTRMTVKYNALTAIDSQSTSLLQILDDIRKDRTSTHEAQAKASGLLRWLESFEFSFAQTIALELFGMTDELSKQLQNPKLSAAEGLESVMSLKMLINTKRTDMHFESIWRDVEVRRSRFNGADAKLPRTRHAPRRLEEGGDTAEFQSVAQYFRIQYYLVLDKVNASISDRFESAAWKIMHCMEKVLIESCRGEDPNKKDMEAILIHAAGDLNNDLVGQLCQLRNIPMSTEERASMTSFSDVLTLMKKERALLRLLPQVVKLVKLICVLPCSTATPERSFSQLRRIKNYMRSTMTQERLNHTMIAAVHSDKVDDIDIEKMMAEFILRNEERRADFAICKQT